VTKKNPPGRARPIVSAPAAVGTAACGTHAAVSCLTCSWRDSAEWGVLDKAELRRLDAARSTHVYKPGQVVYYQGTPALGVFCVESGEIVLRRADAQGHSAVTGMATPGRALGYRAFFAGGAHGETAEALTETRICFIDRGILRELLDKDSRLGHRFFKRAEEDLSASEQARMAMGLLDVRQRLAHLLLALKERRGSVEPDGTLLIDLPLSRQDIASLLGVRPETITRTIRAMEDAGVASFVGRSVRVPDLNLLLDELESTETV